jgi:signal transduction histidine kinase/ligand-binding sensor domain-containing protein
MARIPVSCYVLTSHRAAYTWRRLGMNRARIVWSCALLALLSLAEARPHAQTAPPLSDYTITSWSRRDGVTAPVWSIVQDKNGYLWVGTGSGLLRFDGQRFVQWETLGHGALPANAVLALLAARDGSLWIGAGEAGIGRLSNGRFTFYRDEDLAFTRTIIEDRHGTVWAGSREGLYRFDGTAWVAQAESAGLPPSPNNGIYEDAAGALWVRTLQGTYRRAASQQMFEHVPNPPTLPGQIPEQRLAAVQSAPGGSRRFGVLRDTHGDLWIPSLGQGLTRVRVIHNTERVEHITTDAGLSSNVIGAVYEDRESNIWIGTQAGLHELTPRKVTPIDDLGGVTGVRTTDDGSTWFASDKGLIRVTREGRHTYTQQHGLPPGRVWALATDRRDSLWIATDHGGLARFNNGRIVTLLPGDRRLARVTSMSLDSAETAWITDYQSGVMRLKDGILEPLETFAKLDRRRPIRAYVDRADRVWLGFGDGQIGLLERGGVSMHGLGITGSIGVIHENQDGVLWLGGENGIARFVNGKATAITSAANGFPSAHVTGIVDDGRGAIWAGTSGGIVRIEHGEFDAVASTPTHRVRYMLYDETDGLQGMPGSLADPAAARASDGRLWFVTDAGVTMIDPASLPPARHAPPVRIEEIRSGSERFDAGTPFKLAPRPERVEIEYTALALSSPRSVRFRYRLSGFDSDWQDAGTRRQASYTNLPPGDYTFQVVALNKEGAFDPAGAVTRFSIAPAFYQTTWFAAGMALGVLMLGTAAWRMRVRQIRDRFSLVLAERTRISREVHDTLLQSLVGVALRSGTAAGRLAFDPAGAREQLNQLRKEVEDQIREVRETIWNLRSPTLESRGLAGAIEDAGNRIASQTSASFTLRTIGQPQPCAPAVEEQMLRIGQEALINAGRHARATELQAELRYEPGAVTLSVIDNGIGFDAEMAAAQNARHFGLTSMRERAEQAGGQVDVITEKGAGTRVVASFPTSSRDALSRGASSRGAA